MPWVWLPVTDSVWILTIYKHVFVCTYACIEVSSFRYDNHPTWGFGFCRKCFCLSGAGIFTSPYPACPRVTEHWTSSPGASVLWQMYGQRTDTFTDSNLTNREQFGCLFWAAITPHLTCSNFTVQVCAYDLGENWMQILGSRENHVRHVSFWGTETHTQANVFHVTVTCMLNH